MSQNCMFELVGIMQHPDYKNRIFPIVHSDKKSRVRENDFYVELLEQWKEKLKKQQKLVNRAKNVNPIGAAPLEEELGVIQDVNNFLADIKRYIDYTNAQSFDEASNERYSTIISAIKRQMEQNESHD